MHDISDIPGAPESFTPRQRAVLDRALELLLEGGERALTTAGLARAASCSKESLYKWFGDRDGLLAAMISHQASKVRARIDDGSALDLSRFRAHLVDFATDLLQVLAGDVSLALNRLAIGQASREGSRLGQLLIERGRRGIDRRAGALLDAGRRRGLIVYGDRDAAYHTLYGLIVRDLHVRMLLGEAGARQPEKFAALAEEAVTQFFVLFGVRENKKADPD
ncbi:TetR/AcrR family transcriptional regulator [Nitratireductor sp. ZSWI3]|uniref:TetR/AcrR family transcriptional regulator n=1 Tax=Nitratireductor sp. ZSWI3 TaxID=2966359 RepID=UPI00214F8D8F|nr:TetR/AcrR family transcriptional regulator [Nitratireductor sp. ZSWI3]MCR4267147.1 TetR/AcrR family transcriptional regulator [Nitratireductor sp. ZSWI3]